MLYLIGLAHRAQAYKVGSCLTVAQREFAECLQRAVDAYRPALIAEEDNEENLGERDAVSVAKEIADARGIEHRFCDPNRDEHRAIGYVDGQTLEIKLFMADWEGLSNNEIRNRARAIEIGKYFPLRERFWFDRLNGYRHKVTLFICGDGHIESFSDLLEAEGVSHATVARGIGLNEQDSWFAEAKQYLHDHPEILEG